MNFILRPWKIDDLNTLVKYANNPNVAKNMMDGFPNPYTAEKGIAFIENAMQEHIHLFAIDVNGEAVGGIGIHPLADIQRKNAELGYWLAEPFWNNGIITKAIKQMIPIGFKLYDINRIFARPFGTNKGSQKALEKAGFQFEARFEKTFFKNGEFVDELYYVIRKTD
ncbi:MAG: GNAT family N-acetyltransferase [Crocinitomicaceae bacterium]|jgi:ribosomal-protein-alanine N-acetyltransferase|nr:GNAT family N-acetyltransferase [Crocinitomicaceae bacterium]MBK6950673.1 GNAT family N-acetyltransferase [Crocinitomicaceae bacterium]